MKSNTIKRLFQISITLLILAISCKQNEANNTDSGNLNSSKLINSKALPNTFEKKTIIELFNKLKSNFKIDFKLIHLNKALNRISILELKKGKVFEKEMLFENFDCECYDKISISFQDHRFILDIYEEFFEKELDWCPETSYRYSFKIVNKTITDLKLDYMAG